MRWICSAFAVVTLMLGGAADAAAQAPASITYGRAYQHFLNSRYSYRTLYSSVPGSRRMMYAPFVYQSQFIEPSFSRQRISPYGYDRFDLVPGYGSAILTPFGMSGFYSSGFGHGIVAPNGAQPFQYFTP